MLFTCLICARGGSKGLPGKNSKPLGGIPLISRTVQQAVEIDRVDRILVSTDSAEIAELASEAGAEVPFLRPDSLAADDTPEWKVWQHMLGYILEDSGSLPDGLAVLPVTSPLRRLEDIEACLDEYEKDEADVVITVTDAHRSPYFNMVKLNERGDTELVIPPDSPVFRRQDSPVVYDMTTVAFISRPAFVLEHDGIWEGAVRQVHVPLERAIDIDTAHDFRMAEILLKQI